MSPTGFKPGCEALKFPADFAQRDGAGEGADIGGDVGIQILGADMARGRQRGHVNGGVDPDIGAAPPLMQRAAEMGQRVLIRDVHRRQRGTAAGGLDPVVEIFQAPHGARDRNDMRAALRQPQRRGRADPA